MILRTAILSASGITVVSKVGITLWPEAPSYLPSVYVFLPSSSVSVTTFTVRFTVSPFAFVPRYTTRNLL